MSTRIERTENCYRQAMKSALINLLEVINPADQIQFGAMKYEELVVYARDWLNTEKHELMGEPISTTVYPARDGSKIVVEEFGEPKSLSLE